MEFPCRLQWKKDRVYRNGEKINGYELRDRVERALDGLFAAGMTNVLTKRTVMY